MQKQDDENLRARLNRETAQISWIELQKFYAAGNLVAVVPGLNLLDVAEALHRDQVQQFQEWLSEGKVFTVGDSQAQQWFDRKTTHWAVVVAPFVLVQEVVESDKQN